MKSCKCSTCKNTTIKFSYQGYGFNNCAQHIQCQQCALKNFNLKENYNQCPKCLEFMFFNLGDQLNPICSLCKNKSSNKKSTLKRLCKNHLICSGCIRNKDYRTEFNCEFCKDAVPMICMQCIQPCSSLHPNKCHLIHKYCSGCIQAFNKNPSSVSCSLCRMEYTQKSTQKSENRCSYCSNQNIDMFKICKNHIMCFKCYEIYSKRPDVGESCQECINIILEMVCNTKLEEKVPANDGYLEFEAEKKMHIDVENAQKTDKNIKAPNMPIIRENPQSDFYVKGNNKVQHDSLTNPKMPEHSNKVDQTNPFILKKHTFSEDRGIKTTEYTNERSNQDDHNPIRNHSKSGTDINNYLDYSYPAGYYGSSNPNFQGHNYQNALLYPQDTPNLIIPQSTDSHSQVLANPCNIPYNLNQSSSNKYQNYDTSSSHFNKILPSNPLDISNPENKNNSSYATYEFQARNPIYSGNPNYIQSQVNPSNPNLCNPCNKNLQGYNTYSSKNSYLNPSNVCNYPNSASPSYSTSNALSTPSTQTCMIHKSDYYYFEGCSHYQCYYCITTNFKKKFNKFLSYLSTRNIEKLNNPRKGLLGCSIKRCSSKYCIPYDYVKHEALEICISKNYPPILSEHYQKHFEGIRATFFNCPICTFPSGYYFEKKCLYCN